MTVLVSCKKVSKEYMDQMILKNITFDIGVGERIGLVGKNGSGKSTLVNLLNGSLNPDGGNITWYQKDVKIGYQEQSVNYSSVTFNELLQRQIELQDFLETSSMLGVKKVNEWEIERLDSLSGGEKTKLALANVWSEFSTFLILDEPTNHMDYEGTQWLIEKIDSYPGTIMIISHDRYFLDQTVTKILEIEDGEIQEYKGNYSFYRDEKQRRYASQMHAYEEQQKTKERINSQIKQLKNWSDKAHRESTTKGLKSGTKIGAKEYFRVKAKKKDQQIKSRIKRLEKIDVKGVKKPKAEETIHFLFQESEKKGKIILEVKDLQKSFGKRTLFKDSSFTIQRGERIGLFGNNGTGKSTFIKGVLGELSLEGLLYLTPSVKIGYLSQDVFDLNEDCPVLDLFEINNRTEEGAIRTMLANLGLDDKLVRKKIGFLSLGERTKVKIARLLLGNYDLLILDEPTNHLDLHAREQLEEALSQYNRTLLLITHDRYLLERTCDRLLLFKDGAIRKVEYGLTRLMNKQKDHHDAEQKMMIENEIAYVLGELSKYNPGEKEYLHLEERFQCLLERKRRL
ncbi:ABC-F type ribosomal protection protein [Anaerobacillus alkaliphilus]|uniref:ABC-F type ribosomal protection protein n=1 Tax=Anaerobacillus alkaliphilus TaxID=1548597 RepID=A0A4Q0VU28_9BACI|nr:ABC-F type ribosomal protection protein [Anaerobacillus alkaliphilus]RXJ02011.1 ABC-F type ribosomal protection protein [Anaerobacillus alkaliphilus]